MSVTDRHDMTLAVKMALNHNTINQPTSNLELPCHESYNLTLNHAVEVAIQVDLHGDPRHTSYKRYSITMQLCT